MRRLMLSYFVADIVGIYFYFFHVVQDNHILGIIHLKYTKVKNIRNTFFRERKGSDYYYSNSYSLLSQFQELGTIVAV